MAVEITIVLKDEEKSLRVKHLVYDKFCFDHQDPVMTNLIADAQKQFEGEPSDIRVKASLTIL